MLEWDSWNLAPSLCLMAFLCAKICTSVEMQLKLHVVNYYAILPEHYESAVLTLFSVKYQRFLYIWESLGGENGGVFFDVIYNCAIM